MDWARHAPPQQGHFGFKLLLLLTGLGLHEVLERWPQSMALISKWQNIGC
jgi:hypothetical protein